MDMANIMTCMVPSEPFAPSSIDHYGTQEVGELAQAVLDMAEVLQSREMAVRGYTDHVTHELKTPLTAIRGAAELLEADEDLTAESRHLVEAIAEAEKRAVKLLGAAREIAAARMPEHRGTTSLSACLTQLRERFPQIEIDADNADEKIPLAQSGLEIVLGQLTQNAVGAGATRMTLMSGKGIEGTWLRVADNGPGISSGNATKVFEPFFTTKRDSGGTGMGLAIVQTLLLAHGSLITIDPDVVDGTGFRISF